MKKRILIVEKDKGIREALDYLLTDVGYDVRSFSHLDGILTHIEEYNPQVILFDIVVPGVEDSDICRLIKVSEKTKHVPVIVLSTNPKVTATIKEVCADEVISKPFDIEELLETIETQIAA